MKSISPYLHFPGTAEAAFTLYKSVFGGTFAILMRYGEGPMAAQVPAADRSKILHVSLPLVNGTVLMASDMYDGMGKPLVIGTNCSISIEADSDDEATRIFNGLSAGGIVGMPLQNTFWGAFFGMCVDRFGIQWMVSHSKPAPPAA